MKLTTFLVFSCLFAAVFTLSTTTEKLRNIAQGQFGRTLLDTIQLEFKSSANADPRPRILQLLEEIKQEALDAINALNEQHGKDQQACQDRQNSLQSAIDELNNQIQEASAEVAAKTDEVTSVTAARDAQQSIIDNLQPYLDQITAVRNQDQQAFEDEDNKNAQILAVLQRTEQFITDRLQARQTEQTGSSGSFLERDNVLIQVKATVTSPSFQKISPGYGKLINFLATKALHKFKQTEDDATAVAGLQSIVNAIDILIANHNAIRVNAQAANDAAKEAFEQESANIQSQLATANNAVSTSNAQLSSVQSRIADLTGSINSNTDTLNNNKDALYRSQRDCSTADDQYQQSFSARNAELGLIDEVIDIVNNDLTNLRQFTEDTIVNSDIVVD